jgi:hypothetical protein
MGMFVLAIDALGAHFKKSNSNRLPNSTDTKGTILDANLLAFFGETSGGFSY